VAGKSLWGFRLTEWHWDTFFLEYFGFPLSVSLHQCFVLIFIFKLLLTRRTNGRSLVTSKAVLCRISEELCTEEALHVELDGIALAKETRSSSRKPSDTGTGFLRVHWGFPCQCHSPVLHTTTCSCYQ